MKTFKGIGSSDGIAIGSCYVLDRLQVSFQRKMIADCDVEYECSRLDKAVAAATEYIEEVRSLGRESMEEGHAVIFDVYIMLLRDDMLIGRSKKIIRDTLVNAEYALHTVGGEISRSFRRAEDEYLRERGNDIIHIVRKLMRFLTGEGYGFLDKVDENAIVISHDLSPSDTTHILQKNIKGISTELGSKVSHTSILARSLGLPAVVGIAEITKSVSTGDTIIIDGFEGIIIVNPDADTLEKYKHKEKRYRDYMSTLESLRDTEVKSADNVDVYLFSNIELNEEINLSNLNNASGIGLYRTEFIYLQHGDVSEEKQFEILKEAVVLNAGKPTTIRTFDLGGEKLSSDMPHPKEQNPALGLRALRYSIRFKEFFLKQLRAILRASAYGDVRIMFPMVSGVAEFRKAVELFYEAQESLRNDNIIYSENIKLGVMVELPSLAIISPIIAKEVDFFSVGTNDLIQYTLGIDRNNEYVAYLYRPAHPAIISLLNTIIKAARSEGIDCSVCGEIAGEPRYIPILLGLGYRHLSMSPTHILKAKKLISQLKVADCEKLIEELILCDTSIAAEEKVKAFVDNIDRGIFFS